MLKRYYTLQEAADYLSEKLEPKMGASDILELAARGSLRLCYWYIGRLMRFEAQEENPFDYQPPSQMGINFRGYIQVPSYAVTPRGGDIELSKVAAFEAIHKTPWPANEVMPAEEYKSWVEPWVYDPVIYAPFYMHGMELDEDGNLVKVGSIERRSLNVPLSECVVPADDLAALVEGGEPEPEIPALVEASKAKRGVSLEALKLYAWPLGNKFKDCDQKLVDALYRSAWVKGAVVCKDPLTVNPALLAFALQDKKKIKTAGFFVAAKQLGNHLSENFPEYFDEYEELIKYEKEL